MRFLVASPALPCDLAHQEQHRFAHGLPVLVEAIQRSQDDGKLEPQRQQARAHHHGDTRDDNRNRRNAQDIIDADERRHDEHGEPEARANGEFGVGHFQLCERGPESIGYCVVRHAALVHPGRH